MAFAVAGGGVVLGSIFTQASSVELFGTLVAFLAAATAFYRLSASVSLLAFSYPFDLRTFAGPLKITTSAALMTIIVLTWVTRRILAGEPAWRSTPLDVPVLLFAGATLFSLSGLGGQWEAQAIGLLKAAGGFLMFFIATQSLASKTDIYLVLGAILGTGLIQAAITALPVLNGSLVIGVTGRASGTMLEANLFAGYLVMVMPLAVAFGMAFRSRWSILPTVAVASTFAMALIATWSRSAWLGILGATGLLMMLWPRRRVHLLAIAGSVALILLAVGLFATVGVRLAPGESGPLAELADRWSLWVAAIQITMHHPLGVGVGNFGYYYGLGASHAHNLFLNILVERGIIGLAAFLLVVVSLFRTMRSAALTKAGNELDRALVVGLIASLGGYFVHSIFDATYYDYKVLLLFWLLIAIVAVLPSILVGQEDKVDQAGESRELSGHRR